jgi:hypothetical protein
VLVEKKLTTGGVAVTDALAGLMTVLLLPEDTEDFRPGSYYFEVELHDADGSPLTVEFADASLTVEADTIRSGA